MKRNILKNSKTNFDHNVAGHNLRLNVTKGFLFCLMFSFCFQNFLFSQQFCHPSGNLAIYSNYDGGILTINVDQDIPNLKIGICTFEPVKIFLTGSFVSNVTQVIYAGHNDYNGNNNCSLGVYPTSISGVSASIVTINVNPPVGYTPTHNNGTGQIYQYGIDGGTGACDTLNAGGSNTPDEIVYYFEAQTGGQLYFHNSQYACWMNDTVNISGGGTCCIVPSINSTMNCYAPKIFGSALCSTATASVEFSNLPSGIWTVTTFPGGATTTDTGATTFINGLIFGTSYTFTLTHASGCVSAPTPSKIFNPPFPQSSTIYGQVANVTNGNVVIYKYNPLQTNFDTLKVAPLDSFGNYHFTGINAGNYLIKAFADTTNYPTLIPTYYGNAFLWNDTAVKVVNYNCTVSDTLPVITMIEETGTGGGIGILSGQIIEGLGFIRSEGEPIPGVDVKLGKKPSGSIAAATITNATGNYTFSGVAFGNYAIYVDIPGLGRDSSFTFTVDSANNQFLQLNYIADSSSVYINPNTTTGISNFVKADENKFSVYPNPGKGIFTIATKENDYTLIITNVLGENVYQSEMYGSAPLTIRNQKKEIDLSKQPNGIYFLNIKTSDKSGRAENKSFTQKIIINK